MSEIILARHAETIWNEQLKYIGRTDLGLSELGKSNAKQLADFLLERPVRMVFSSNQRRAIETASEVADCFDLALTEESDLRELDFGIWEGLTFSEIQADYPELASIWMTDPLSVKVPEAESWSHFFDRVWRGWQRIFKEIKKSETRASKKPSTRSVYLVVTHAGCIKVILGRLMGIKDRDCWQTFQDKGALNYIDIGDGKVKIVKVNDTDYRKNSDIDLS